MSYPINPYILANSQGIPRLQANSVTVNTSEVRFSFQNHRFLNAPFVGLILFKLPSIPTGTTATLPVVFATNGNNQAAINYETGAPLTVADLLKSSITDEQHLALYVKDVVDDVDAGDGEIMREWDAKMTSRGIAVDWEEIL